MKKVLLSLLLIGSVSSVFAQFNPCPETIKSNQGGGTCTECKGGESFQRPNKEGSPRFALGGTAVVTLDFGSRPIPCIPKLLRITAKDGQVREVDCGLGNRKGSSGPNFSIIEYCIFGTPGDDFFNQPDLVATLDFSGCPGFPTSIGQTQFGCTSTGNVVAPQSPLPVSFRSFTAARNKGNVAVRWTTSTEIDNKGFNIQRNTRGVWETVAFVASQATGGNSTSDLSYSFTDANSFSGVSQYRIQQVDIDGRSKISEIRAVQGEAQSGRTVVYPNPSNEGSVNVVFDATAGARNVIVSDISGRVIKSWRGIKESTLKITNLMPGTYMLRIVNEGDGQSSFEKVVVNK